MPPGLLPFIPQIIGLVANAFGLDDSSDETKIKLAQVQLEADKMLSQQLIAQAEVNQVEAASTDKFVSRWRPFIGWVCGVCFLLVTVTLIYQWVLTGKQPDLSFLWAVMGSLLGIGAMRSYDKKNGTG